MTLAIDLAKAARDRHIRMYILPTIHGFSMSGRASGRLMDTSLVGKPIELVKKIKLQSIVAAVCQVYRVRLTELQAHTYPKALAAPRFHAVGLARDLRPDLSLVHLAKLFNRDHSTLVNSHRKWLARKDQYKEQAIAVLKLLEGA